MKQEEIKDKNKKQCRQKCEVWSRVVGYLRPISRWNEGKAAEFKDRMVFKQDNKEVKSC